MNCVPFLAQLSCSEEHLAFAAGLGAAAASDAAGRVSPAVLYVVGADTSQPHRQRPHYKLQEGFSQYCWMVISRAVEPLLRILSSPRREFRCYYNSERSCSCLRNGFVGLHLNIHQTHNTRSGVSETRLGASETEALHDVCVKSVNEHCQQARNAEQARRRSAAMHLVYCHCICRRSPTSHGPFKFMCPQRVGQ